LSQLISCGKCKKTWTGNAVCHCGGCHETFTGVTAFDAHQRTNPEGQLCGDPDTKGLVARQKPWGVVWGYDAGDWDFGRLANDTRTKVD
jgi:hypothetical protein